MDLFTCGAIALGMAVGGWAVAALGWHAVDRMFAA